MKTSLRLRRLAHNMPKIIIWFYFNLFIPLFNSFISFYEKLQVFKQFISPVLYYFKYCSWNLF